jgi:tetratricopeptide (TPR) repeat protein
LQKALLALLKKSVKKSTILLFSTALLFVLSSSQVFGQKKENKAEEEKVVSKYEMANAEFLMIEAQKFFLLEDYQRSLAFLEQSLDVDPNNHAAHFKIAEISFIQGQYAKGLKAIKQAQELKPTNRFYYLLAAQLYRLENNLQAASEEYEAMIRNTTNYRDYLLDLADLYVALENYDKAIETLNLTEDKFNTPNKFATQKKELLLQAGKEKEAINLFKNLSEKSPENEDYKLEYVDLLTSLGKTKEAEQILNASSISGESNLKLLSLKIQSGDFSNIKTSLKSAFSQSNTELQPKLSIIDQLAATPFLKEQSSFIDSLQSQIMMQFPNNLEVLKTSEKVYSALALSASGEEKTEFEKTELITLRKLKDLNPSNYEIWEKLLTRSYDQQAWDKLLTDTEDALSYFPNQGLFYYYYGNAQMYSTAGDEDEASSAFDQALKLSKSDSELQNAIKAQQFILGIEPKQKTSEKAVTTSRALEKDQGNISNTIKTNPKLKNGLSASLEVLYQYMLKYDNPEVIRQTLKAIDDLIVKHPNDPELFITKAKILFQINSFAEAKSTIEQIRGLLFTRGEDQNGAIIEFYGDILFKLNKVDEAVIEWKKAKELGNTSDKIDRKIADKTYYQ